MKSHGSWFRVGLLVLAVGTGASCKKEEPPKPEPAPEVPATAPIRPAIRPRGPGSRLDPASNKEHRIDFCYYGTFSLREARDAYLASLGKDEPSAKKIPSFGAPTSPAARPGEAPPLAPAAASAKAPPAPVKPAAAASGAPGAGPAASTSPAEHRADPSLRLPHERNARSCTSALGLREPLMGDIDAQMAVFAPFSVELAKDISAAQTYYHQQEYTKDNFARGKELDKKLREEFGRLDDLSDKLGAAIAAWRKDHPLDPSKMDDGEKVSRPLIDAARDVFLMVVTHHADGDAWKAALEKLDRSAEAVKAFSDAHPADLWSKIVGPAAEPFLKTIKGAKPTADKSFDADAFLALVANFTSILEGRLRAVARSGMGRAMPLAFPSAAAPAPPAPRPQQ